MAYPEHSGLDRAYTLWFPHKVAGADARANTPGTKRWPFVPLYMIVALLACGFLGYQVRGSKMPAPVSAPTDGGPHKPAGAEFAVAGGGSSAFLRQNEFSSSRYDALTGLWCN